MKLRCPSAKPRLRPQSLRSLRPTIERLEFRRVLADDLAPVLDINTQLSSLSSQPTNVTSVGSQVYFLAQTPTTGTELWKSDGTSAGTVLVKEFIVGRYGVSPYLIGNTALTNVNGTLFFTVDDQIHGAELWKSDGTAAGTTLVKDINPGVDHSYPRQLLNFNGTLYFVARSPSEGRELWKSDGTEAGTVLVKDIFSGSGYGQPSSLTVVGSQLFFRALDASNGAELWKSDGTSSGTLLVKDIAPGTASSSLQYLANLNGTLYFTANDGTNGEELWKSDGTNAGTMLFKDIRAGASGSSPRSLLNVAGTIYFRANDGASGLELWKSDGTTAGTVLVKDINAGTPSSILLTSRRSLATSTSVPSMRQREPNFGRAMEPTPAQYFLKILPAAALPAKFSSLLESTTTSFLWPTTGSLTASYGRRMEHLQELPSSKTST